MTIEDRATRLVEIGRLARSQGSIAADDALWMSAELQASDTRAKEMAGLLREAADQIDLDFVGLVSRKHLWECAGCGEQADRFAGRSSVQHASTCFVNRLRTAADHGGKTDG